MLESSLALQSTTSSTNEFAIGPITPAENSNDRRSIRLQFLIRGRPEIVWGSVLPTSPQPNLGAIPFETIGSTQPNAKDAQPVDFANIFPALQRASLPKEIYGRLLSFVMGASRGDGNKFNAILLDSLQTFAAFWSRVNNLAVIPELFLAGDGSIIAEWARSMRSRLDVRFKDRKAYFGVITDKNALEGFDTPTAIAEILLAHPKRPLKWGK